MLDLLAGASLQPVAPRRGEQNWPTSRPRQIPASLSTRIMNYKGVPLSSGSRRYSGPPATGPRVWFGGLDRVRGLTTEKLGELVRDHTRPVPSRAYQDSNAVKEAFRAANPGSSGRLPCKPGDRRAELGSKTGYGEHRNATGRPSRTL